MKPILICLLCITLFSETPLIGQAYKNWQWKDLSADSVHGISVQQALNLASKLPQQAQTIIVAILDGGIDTNHIAIKKQLWINPKEIPNNKIDDDHNGYIDDVHGWNFLGGKDGRNINKASDEKSRIYHAFKNLYANNTIDTSHLNATAKKQYRIWKTAEREIEFSDDERANLQYITFSKNVLFRLGKTIIKEVNDSNFTATQLEQYQPLGRMALEAKIAYLRTLNMLGIDKETGHTDVLNDLSEYIEGKEKAARGKEEAPALIRAEIVQDNYADIHDKFYGNNDIMGPNARHGTHVAGLALHELPTVKIMGVRVVPDGDEYDKDIALGIIYAVDNGAKIINMSFGKSFSPQQNWVDSAIRYAAKKDVLIIHSAGNEKYDLNTKQVYPNPYSELYNDSALNMITIGASSDSLIKGTLLTDFSNVGNKIVDVLSPGDKIYSTLPNNNYGFLSGTSMSAPIVTNIAALIRSYFPQFTAQEVKSMIVQNSWHPTDEATATILTELCKSGGIVNAAIAMNAAIQYDMYLVKNKRGPKQTKNKRN